MLLESDLNGHRLCAIPSCVALATPMDCLYSIYIQYLHRTLLSLLICVTGYTPSTCASPLSPDLRLNLIDSCTLQFEALFSLLSSPSACDLIARNAQFIASQITLIREAD